MLDAMRRGAVNWVAKALLGLLVIAFAFWGVADVFRGYGRGTLARIGNTEISVEEFRQAYEDELASVSRRMGRRLSSDQAHLLGIDQRALSRLIGSAAVDAHARELHLGLSEQGMAEIIREDTAFHDASGAFSNAAFQSYLRQSGNSEGRYMGLRRREELRDQITDTLLSGVTPPAALIDLLHRYRQETRQIEFFTPEFDKLIKIPEPDEARIREYYESNPRQFMVPELRKVNLLALTRADAKARMPVSEEEVKADYEQNKDKYSVAEKRHILQLSFPDKLAAEAAYTELAKAKDFKQAATKLGFKESDFDLGLLARRDMIDSKIAAAAFALNKDELSKPIEGQFSIALVRVSEIVPGKQRSFEEVKGEIKDRIADERATQEMQTLHDQIEDQRAAGKPLQEIAAALKLPFREIAETDRNGKTAGGKPAIDLPEASRIAQAAFAGSAGIEAEAAELADGGFAWVDVLSVTPEKQKPFLDVQAEAKNSVMEEERRKEITALAGKLTERLKKGETMEAIAKEVGGKVERTQPLTRTATPPGLSQNAIQQAFALPKGGATSSPTQDGKARTILRVADVVAAPPPTAEQAERLRSELSRELQSDVLAEYLSGLQTRYGLSVNNEAIKQALGTPEGQQPDLE
jgi:peptidyl-prolyl cis-trans isomerase D